MPGESFQRIDACEVFTCRDDFKFRAIGCGVINFDKEKCSEYEPDLTLPYPKCCNRIKCTVNGVETINYP